MAKKKAKKGAKSGLITSIVVVVMAVLVFAVMGAPFIQISIDGEVQKGEEVAEYNSAYNFVKNMNEKISDDEDAKTTIEMYKEMAKETKEQLEKLPDGKAKDALMETYNQAKKPIVVYDTIVTVEVLAAFALVAGVVALVLALLKKGPSNILAIVGVVLLLAVFITACVMVANTNDLIELFIGEDSETIKAVALAPILTLVMSLLGTIGGGVTAFLGKRK